MYREKCVVAHVRANTCTSTQSLYIIGNHIFISKSEFDGKFAACMEGTAAGCALLDELTTLL
jgi:hypothetical protein